MDRSKNEKLQSEVQRASGTTSEPVTSGIRSRGTNHSTVTFDEVRDEKEMSSSR
jgi:hypothetical protein